MLTRIFIKRGFTRLPYTYLGNCFRRNYGDKNNNDNNSSNTILPGGGLEKLQGGIKEEKYFNKQDRDLMCKIREQGSKLKCEDCIGNWAEFEKVLDASEEKTALRDTCSMNKHKNCMEEAFFLNEQNDSMKIFQDKQKMDNKNNDSLKISKITDSKRQNSDNANNDDDV